MDAVANPVKPLTAEEEKLTPEERAARLEKEEDEYFEQMMTAF
jgi:hypothetical protein